MRASTPLRLLRRPFAVAAMTAAFCVSIPLAGAQATVSQINMEVPPVVGRSTMLGHADPSQTLHLSIAMPYGDNAGIKTFVDAVSDPHNPIYRQFITPEEVGVRFGLPQSTVDSEVAYFKSKGFKIELVAKNRLNILATATVAQAEAAFGTTINNYQAKNLAEPGRTSFYSFSTPIKMPSALAPYILNVEGIENFTKPKPLALTCTQTRTLYNLDPIYNAGMQGAGRTVAISNWDGFRLSNVPLYYSHFGLPGSANITVVPCGGSGSGAGSPGGEGDLDIQMVLGMAPACTFRIYDGTNDLTSVLTKEANDNLADVISESWGWNLPAADALAAHNLHISMSAQGITYMAASGDSGTSLEPFSYPNYDQETMMVGGTVATVNGSNVRVSEVGWSGGGGGYSTRTDSFNTLPSWQVGTGVPTTINKRLSPDVSLHSSSGSGAYQFYLNGGLTSGFVGTSFACPVFAGGLALAEQKIIANGGLPPDGAGKRRFGRIQNVFYGQNGNPSVWFDITSGNNGNLPNGNPSNCTAKWDTVTGWGAINFDAFVASQIVSNPVPTTTSISPNTKPVGAAAFTMTVNGTNFVSGSIVRFNGSNRTTGFTNTTQLTATIPITDMTTAGTFNITVFNPTPGGGTSNAQTFTVTNPVPALTSLSPNTLVAGGSAFTLTVNGSSFVSGCKVRWNGSDRTTTFVNANQVTAAITAADIATVGTASVTVFNAAPGGGTSNALTFTTTPIQVQPSSFALAFGAVRSGGLAQLVTSDDSKLLMDLSYIGSHSSPNCALEATGTSTAASASRIDLTVEASTNLAGCTQKIFVWDYVSSVWVLQDTTTSLASDTVRNISITTNASRYLSGGQVKARIEYFDPGVGARIIAAVDYVHWAIYP